LAQNSNHHEKSIFTTAVYAPLEAALLAFDNWGRRGGKQGTLCGAYRYGP